MNEENNFSLDVLAYRLSSIESEIKGLKELLVSVPILVNTLNDLKVEHKEDFESLNNKINISNDNIEKRFQNKLNDEVKRLETKMKTDENALRLEARNRQDGFEKEANDLKGENEKLKEQISKLEERVSVLEKAPDKKSASKWNYIMDYIFKAAVGIAVTYFIMKLGLQGQG